MGIGLIISYLPSVFCILLSAFNHMIYYSHEREIGSDVSTGNCGGIDDS